MENRGCLQILSFRMELGVAREIFGLDVCR